MLTFLQAVDSLKNGTIVNVPMASSGRIVYGRIREISWEDEENCFIVEVVNSKETVSTFIELK